MRTLACIAVLFLIGCTPEWKAKVESDTSWSGSFNGRTVDGRGNQTVDLGTDEIVCATVQKATRTGRLKVTIEDEGTLSFYEGESKETTAEYGVVTACSKTD